MQAGAKVCALNASRRLNPAKDFRNHRKPYDMPFRGFGDPTKRDKWIGYMDNEYTEGIWEHEHRVHHSARHRMDLAALLRGGRQDQLSGADRPPASATSISGPPAATGTTSIGPSPTRRSLLITAAWSA